MTDKEMAKMTAEATIKEAETWDDIKKALKKARKERPKQRKR